MNGYDKAEKESEKARIKFIKEHRREPTYYDMYGNKDWKKQLKEWKKNSEEDKKK